MPKRVIKIIEPQDQAKNAIALFDSQEKLMHWQEELASNNYIASNLPDYLTS